MSLGRIWTIATNGFREVIRDRILYLIVFFALLLAVALRFLPEIAAGTGDKIFLDFGLAAIGIFGLLVAIFVGTGLVNKEIEKGTVLVLIPKPLSRAELIVGKHLGLSGVLAVLLAAMAAIYLVLLSASQINYPLGSILVSVLFQFFELVLLTAVALLFGVFTSSILATLLAFGVYLMGHLSRDIVELGNLSENPTIEAITQGLYLVLPDLSRLTLRNEAAYGLLPSPLALIGHGAYALLYTALLLAIASLIFLRRQF